MEVATTAMPRHLDVEAPASGRRSDSLTPAALAFLARLHHEFEPGRQELLARRAERQQRLDAGESPDFLARTHWVRAAQWHVAPAPPDLVNRRVQLTGPVDRESLADGVHAGAQVLVADFEDATAPTWSNVIDGQTHLADAVRQRLERTVPEGAAQAAPGSPATLMVRPRGWHQAEPRLRVGGRPMAASLVDFGLYVFHNAAELLERGSGPYLSLAKLESHLEARLWNDVLEFAQDLLGMPMGTIRAVVSIDTLPAAFEMDEMLYELRRHAIGLNAGDTDYLFSLTKRLRGRSSSVLPDRDLVTVTAPFMRAYRDLLVRTAHRRGAHAIGAAAAPLPAAPDSPRDTAEVARLREDLEREAGQGFDGTSVVHPGLVALASATFGAFLGDCPHQIDRPADRVRIGAAQLLDARVPHATASEAGLRANVRVGLRYLDAWLGGRGTVRIDGRMADAATAELCRAQVWQWVRHGVRLREGRVVSADLVRSMLEAEAGELQAEAGREARARVDEARRLFEAVALGHPFAEAFALEAVATRVRAEAG